MESKLGEKVEAAKAEEALLNKRCAFELFPDTKIITRLDSRAQFRPLRAWWVF